MAPEGTGAVRVIKGLHYLYEGPEPIFEPRSRPGREMMLSILITHVLSLLLDAGVVQLIFQNRMQGFQIPQKFNPFAGRAEATLSLDELYERQSSTCKRQRPVEKRALIPRMHFYT
jgi:hypothetical protein